MPGQQEENCGDNEIVSTMSLLQSLNTRYESRVCQAMWVDEWWT